MEPFSSKYEENIGIIRKHVRAAEAWTPLLNHNLYFNEISMPIFKSEKINFREMDPGRNPCGGTRNSFFWEATLSWICITSANISRKSPRCHPSFPLLSNQSFLNSNLLLLAYEIQSQVQTPDGDSLTTPLSSPNILSPSCLPKFLHTSSLPPHTLNTHASANSAPPA